MCYENDLGFIAGKTVLRKWSLFQVCVKPALSDRPSLIKEASFPYHIKAKNALAVCWDYDICFNKFTVNFPALL